MLKESIKQLTAVFDLLAQPVILSENHTVIYCNNAANALAIHEGDVIGALSDQPLPADGDVHLTLTLCGKNFSAAAHPLKPPVLCWVLQPLDSAQLSADYLSVVSSQIRKPLGDLLIASRRLLPDLDEPCRDSVASRQACIIYRGLYQLQRLAGQLSDGSQLAQGKQALRLKRTELKQFLQNLADTATELLHDSNVKFRYSGLRQPKSADIDPEKVERAIWNLLSNAIAYSPESGVVELAAEVTASTLLLHVTDYSTIDPSIRACVFNRYAYHPGLTDHRDGLGFGLSIVRQVAALHGGTTILCTQPDHSTCVTMSIKLKQAEQNLHEPTVDFDYSGGMNHALVELSNVLPVEMYHPLDLDG